MTLEKAILKATSAMLAVHTAKKAVCVLSPTTAVTVARRFRFTARNTRHEFVLTIGRPNYRVRQIVKDAQKAGEPFPIKRLQLVHFPSGKR